MASPGKQRPIKERFGAAVGVIQSLPKDGSFQPSNTMKLRFYALYKQAKEGPCTLAKPSFWDAVGRAKWEAWTVCGRMSSELAMQMYVEELQQMVEAMPQSPEVEEFLKSIGPFYENVEDEEVQEVDTQESDRKGCGDTRSGSGLDVVGEEEEEKDGPKKKNDGKLKVLDNEVWSGNHSDGDSDDFQESFQILPTTIQPPPLPGDTIPDGAPEEPDTQSSPSSNNAESAELGVSSEVKRSVVIRLSPEGDGGVSPEDEDNPILSRLLAIQTSLQSILHQISTLVSSINARPQLHPQPHPQSGIRLSLLLYRLVPFLLGWPLIVQFIIHFLNKRFGYSTPLPGWIFSLITFLHTMVGMALFIVSSHTNHR